MRWKLSFVAAALLCGLLLAVWAWHAAASSLAQGTRDAAHRVYLPFVFGPQRAGDGVDARTTPSPTPVPPPTPLPSPIAPPADGSIYTGVALVGVPWNMNLLTNWEEHVAGKKVSIVHFWSFWSINGVFQPFSPKLMDAVRDHGSIPMITWSPERMGGGKDQPEFRLSNIIGGQYDAQIKQWADKARAWGHPFFLRFAQEPDGSWFPWGEDANGNQRGQYVQAWRHVHDLFTAAGATNATWVWCPNQGWENAPRPSYASLYPGDDYVDWTCVDGYNWGTQAGSWWTFDQIFRWSYNALLKVAPTKPIMLGEWASSGVGGVKGDWIIDALTVQIPRNYPQIRAEIWYNVSTIVDWRVESAPGAPEAFRAALASGKYRGAEFGR